MQKISDLVRLDQWNQDSSQRDNIARMTDEKTKHILNRLFIRFERIFPKFWVNIKSQEHLNGIKLEWFDCFQRCKITDASMLQVGLQRARENGVEYLPKASTFIRWCTEQEPQDLGFLDIESAYHCSIVLNRLPIDPGEVKKMALDGKNDLVIRHTIRQMDAMLYRNMPAVEARKQFSYYYPQVIKKYLAGDLDRPVTKALESDRGKKTVNVRAEYLGLKDNKSAIQAMREILKR